MEAFIASLGVFFLSSLKFLSGLVVALFHPTMKVLPSYITTVGGGIVGVFAFTFFGDFLRRMNDKLFPNRKRIKFTAWNRRLVKFRRTFGVPGIAFLTPVLSVPIGVFLSLSVSKNKTRIIGFMVLSFTVWSSVFFLPKYLFGLNLYEFITNLF